MADPADLEAYLPADVDDLDEVVAPAYRDVRVGGEPLALEHHPRLLVARRLEPKVAALRDGVPDGAVFVGDTARPYQVKKRVLVFYHVDRL